VLPRGGRSSSGAWLERIEDPVELGVHGLLVRLVEHGLQECLHPRPRALRRCRHQVRGVVRSASLPACAGQHRAGRGHQPGVRIGGDELHPGQAPRDEIAEERQPARAVLRRAGLDAEDLPVTLRVHPGRQQHGDLDHPAALPNLHRQRVRRDERVRARIEGPVRNCSTCSSKSLAISDTCDLDSPVIPRDCTRSSIRLVETPRR